jgi:hypothetical protein
MMLEFVAFLDTDKLSSQFAAVSLKTNLLQPTFFIKPTEMDYMTEYPKTID